MRMKMSAPGDGREQMGGRIAASVAERKRAAVPTSLATADPGVPPARGLYDPALDKDSCGVGFIADIKGKKSHQIVKDAITILLNLEHRGAVGALFLPHEPERQKEIVDIYAEVIADEGMRILGWRDIPTDNSTLGVSVK